MARTTILTQANHLITLSVDGQGVPGAWMQFEGGALSMESTTVRPGGMADRVVLTATPERDEVTLTREYDYLRDGALRTYLEQALIDGLEAIAMVQDLDQRKQPVGEPVPYKGVLSTVTPPERDSSGSDAATWSVTLTVQT